MTCLPEEDFGTEYYIFTSGAGHANQFAIANGRYENVIVEITVSGSLQYNGLYYGNSDTFSVVLNYQQVIQFQSSTDLTGTRIVSSVPVAVISGNRCFTGINSLCDVLVEQLYPVENWGRFFAVFPLLDHTRDIIDIIAASPNTTVTIKDPRKTTQYNLQQGSHVRLKLADRIIVNSSEPIMISYLLQETIPGLVTDYDPFFVTVPPLFLTRKYYKFVTQDKFYNFLLIVSQAPSLSDFYLDHEPLNFQNVSMTELHGIKGWEVSLGKLSGQHEIYHESLEFVIYVYGIETYISYGYTVGQESRYPDPPSPQPTKEPGDSEALTCLSDGAVYQLHMGLLVDADLSVDDIHLEDPSCKAEKDGSFAVIKIPFNRCGSRVLNEDGKTLYVNTVYGTIPDTSIHRIEVPVICGMETNETLEFSFHPKVTDVVAEGHYNISLKLYQSEEFDDPILSYPYEIELNGKLYVGFKVESDDEDLQILVEDCRSAPSLENNAQNYHLIRHGCPVDSTVHQYSDLDQREKHFRIHMFKFDDSSEVYLACNVIICHNSTSPNRCSQFCASHRHRRSVRNDNVKLGSAMLSQGPITFKQGDNIPHAEILSDKRDLYTFPSTVFMGLLCTVGILSAAILILQRRYYKVQEYTLLRNSIN
ncbi:Hypothetical predicted protein [Pelobates cultripes]|uniref:ZP domain-containing protein n=1 Tax=Pelobates cultripes TaxID=61616 RepID=A0AAD1T1E4_PELCU|nr:Hypothetical predicted protein [Pelobates cultripes]